MLTASCLNTELPSAPGPGVITGRVLVATPGEPLGSPVAGASVRLVEAGVTTVSDADGRFSVTPVLQRAGTLEVSAGALKRVYALETLGAGFGRVTALGDVQLSRNASAQGEVQLLDGGDATGTLVFLEGQPNFAYTSQSGAFLLRDLPVGPVTLGVFLAGYRSVRVPLELRSGERSFVDPFVLEPEPQTLATVTGRAVLAEDADASGITVSIGARAVRVDAAGGWRIEGLAPGVYAFTFTAEGHSTVTLANRLVAAETVELPLVTLTAGSTTPPVIEPPPAYDAGAGGGDGSTGGGTATGGGAATDAGAGAFVTRVSAGAAHTCAILDDARAFCWGRDTFGQVSGPAGADSIAPVLVATDVVDIAAGGTHTCAVHTDAGVECWGLNTYYQLGTASVDAGQRSHLALAARSISAGLDFTCAVVGATINCWGHNNASQSGSGSGSSAILPTAMYYVTIPEAVALGDAHTCALMTVTGSPSVKCAGSPFSSGSTPGGVVLSDVRQLASGGQHTCAAKLDGTVWCWGSANVAGELGSDGGLTPTPVSSEQNALAVAAGGQHSCALHTDGSLTCWGGNAYGQLGNGTRDGGMTPITASLTDVTSVSAGGTHTCAIRDGGTLWCWGDNAWGQLGASAGLSSTVPLQVVLPP